MKINLIAPFFILLSSLAIAQDNPDWEYLFPDQAKWQSSDKVFQINYGYGSEALVAFDYREQKELWKQKISGLEGASLSYVNGHPYIRFGKAAFSEKKRKGERTVIVNRFTGELLFDAEWIDFENIKETYFLANAGLVLLKGKEKKENIMALVKLGEKQPKWKREMPVSKDDFKGLNKLLFENEFKMGPIANERRLVFAYADILFALNTEDGKIAWERPEKEAGITYFTQRENEPDSDIFYATEQSGEDMALNAYRLEDFSPAWETTFPLGKKYNVKFGAEEILARMGNAFNYVSYEGKPRWRKNPEFKHDIEKLYQQGGEYLVWMRDVKIVEKDNKAMYDTSYFLNWLDSSQDILWEQPVAVSGKHLRMGKRAGDRLVLATDAEVAAIDMATGKRMTGELPCINCPYALDTLNNQIVFYSGGQLLGLNYADSSWRRIADKMKWEKDAQPLALKILPSGYALLSERQLIVHNPEGELVFEKYYPEKATFNPWGVIGALAGTLLGAIFPEEVAALNRSLYESQLIDSEEYMNNALAMYAYKGVGSGLVSGSFAGRLLQGNSKEEQEQILQKFENLWLVRDKFDNNSFGLRIFDLASLQEDKTIWLSTNEEFQFLLEPKLGGILRAAGGKLKFYGI
ncbi:MAG: hypothetical protein KDD10_19380 [Phaeodactylibacter sp.]|nr:hypothetical protein [Phaeodactylibacter sp.]